KTGFPCLDRKTRGLKPGALIILAARPSVGKTALALNIAANVALNSEKRRNVAIFSLEMSSPELAKRMLAYLSGVSLSKMDIEGGLNDNDLKKITNAYRVFLNCGIYIDDYSMNGPADVLSKCRRLKRESGLDLVIIDYLQLMTNTDEKSRSNENRQEEVSKMSRRMKIFARELDCPIIILSQMSRGIEQRNDHRPLLSDLRESGSIEQDADIVSFLYNPSKYNAALPTNQIILEVAKNRSGATGSIVLEWTGETTSFKEIGELDASSSSDSGAPAEQNAVEKIRTNVENETELKEVGVPSDDVALPFAEQLVAADETDKGLKEASASVAGFDDDDEYTYDDADAPPEGDDLPF
ncbi:MAG: DnaB-like helicase C-terminal domain-containing protein, partial [Bacteroides sp.]|nr:DnaB-like helicase C-terminal domain-containing protein [Bacteroides sp.]